MRKLMFALALVSASTLAVGAVADAKQPVRGDQAFVLNIMDVEMCPDIVWFGTVDIRDDDHGAYGMALYDIGVAPRFPGVSYHWEEGFAIWSGLFDENGDQRIDDCTPGDMLLYGTDKGMTSFGRIEHAATDGFHSTGTVLEASGPFAGWEGRHVFQEGSGSFTELTGTLRIN